MDRLTCVYVPVKMINRRLVKVNNKLNQATTKIMTIIIRMTCGIQGKKSNKKRHYNPMIIKRNHTLNTTKKYPQNMHTKEVILREKLVSSQT